MYEVISTHIFNEKITQMPVWYQHSDTVCLSSVIQIVTGKHWKESGILGFLGIELHEVV